MRIPEPIPICVLSAAFPAPSEPTRAVFIETLCRELAALRGPAGGPRFAVSVVAPRVAPRDPLREVRGPLSVRRFRYPSGGRRLKECRRIPFLALGAYLVSGLAATIAEVRRTGARVLHGHWVLPTGPIAALASRATGVPLVLHAHGSDIHRYAEGSRLAALVARRALRRARRVLAASGALARAIEALGIPSDRVSLLPMGADGSVFRPEGRDADRAHLGLDGGPHLLFVGDLIPEKGILAFARALVASSLPARLVVAGSGPDGERLEALACGAPDRLRLLGRLDPQRLAPWYRAADLLVLPSESEGTPVSILEALASGLPVAATAVGGIPDVVRPGVEGWLAPAGATPAEFLEVVGEALGDRAALERIRAGLEASGEDRTAARRARDLAPILEEVARG
jgi:glycosyltransferase involved in cell wall biosynthesis